MVNKRSISETSAQPKGLNFKEYNIENIQIRIPDRIAPFTGKSLEFFLQSRQSRQDHSPGNEFQNLVRGSCEDLSGTDHCVPGQSDVENTHPVGH